MMEVNKFPVAPRPFRDELLSSWMARVAARYGMDELGLAGYLTEQAGHVFDMQQIDNINPNLGLLSYWAWGCRIDPARLEALSLKSRHPDRPQHWFLDRPMEVTSICLDCLDGDFAAGRDSYMRADWWLVEYVVCPVHNDIMLDRCPICASHLHVSFRMRQGHLRPICSKCDGMLSRRGGEVANISNQDFAQGVLTLQKKVGRIVRGDPDRRICLEQEICTLWAPLDRPGAARPVLALWIDQAQWHCPYEAREAVGSQAPLQKLSVRWRAITLVILYDVFGTELILNGPMSDAACRLYRRAAPMPFRSPKRGRCLFKKNPLLMH